MTSLFEGGEENPSSFVKQQTFYDSRGEHTLGIAIVTVWLVLHEYHFLAF